MAGRLTKLSLVEDLTVSSNTIYSFEFISTAAPNLPKLSTTSTQESAYAVAFPSVQLGHFAKRSPSTLGKPRMPFARAGARLQREEAFGHTLHAHDAGGSGGFSAGLERWDRYLDTIGSYT